MKIQSTFNVVDLHSWSKTGASAILDMLPADIDIIPDTSFVIDEDGVSEIPIVKDNHPGSVVAAADVIWTLGADSGASGGSIFHLNPVRNTSFIKHVSGIVAYNAKTKQLTLEYEEPKLVIEEAIFFNPSSKYWGGRLVMMAALAAVRDAIGSRSVPLARFPRTVLEDIDYEALDLIFGRRPEIVNLLPSDFPVKVKKFWIADSPIEWAHGNHTFCDQVFQTFQKRLNISRYNKLNDIVYISRNDTQRRPIDNGGTIEKFLAAHQIRSMTFSGLTIRQRIEALASAKVIVGAAGSNMFNIMFGPPGGWAIEFIPNDWVKEKNGLIQLPRIASSLGRRHIMIPIDAAQAESKIADKITTLPMSKLETALNFIAEHERRESR